MFIIVRMSCNLYSGLWFGHSIVSVTLLMILARKWLFPWRYQMTACYGRLLIGYKLQHLVLLVTWACKICFFLELLKCQGCCINLEPVCWWIYGTPCRMLMFWELYKRIVLTRKRGITCLPMQHYRSDAIKKFPGLVILICSFLFGHRFMTPLY